MRLRTALIAALMTLIAGASSSAAQQQTGEVFGRLTDSSARCCPE